MTDRTARVAGRNTGTAGLRNREFIGRGCISVMNILFKIPVHGHSARIKP